MGWVALAVTAAVAVGSAAAKGDASRKAAGAMKDAIGSVERIDVAKEQAIAQQYDKSAFTGALALQKEADPVLAKLRETGAQQLLDSMNTPEDRKAAELALKAAGEVSDQTPGIDEIKSTLIEQALADLELGATLPPEFQAELVRTGLEAGGRSGIGVAPGTGGAQASRKLLGQAGLELKAARQATAAGMAGAVQDLTATRLNILSNASAFLTNLAQNRFARGATGFGIAQESAPAYGLSGADAVNLDLARINQQQQLTLKSGEVEANKRIAKGEEYAGYIGAAGQAAGGALSLSGLGGGSALQGTSVPVNGYLGGGMTNTNQNVPRAGYRGGFRGYLDRLTGR